MGTFGLFPASLKQEGEENYFSSMPCFCREAKEGVMYPTWGRIARLSMGGAFALALLVALAACAPAGTGTIPVNGTGTIPASSTRTQSQGTLDGVVEAGPTCPVESVTQPCPPKPVPNRAVLIETSGGSIVTQVTTDQQGRFEVNLAPGTYELKVVPGITQYPIQRKPQEVTIVAGQTTQVKIELDTGIR